MVCERVGGGLCEEMEASIGGLIDEAAQKIGRNKRK